MNERTHARTHLGLLDALGGDVDVEGVHEDAPRGGVLQAVEHVAHDAEGRGHDAPRATAVQALLQGRHLERAGQNTWTNAK